MPKRKSRRVANKYVVAMAVALGQDKDIAEDIARNIKIKYPKSLWKKCNKDDFFEMDPDAKRSIQSLGEEIVYGTKYIKCAFAVGCWAMAAVYKPSLSLEIREWVDVWTSGKGTETYDKELET